MSFLFGRTHDLIATVLDFRAQRHKMIVANISNIDTPGYIPREVIFKQELYLAMQGADEAFLTRTHERHMADRKGSDRFLEVVDKGDRVSLDQEMMNLTENQLLYNLSIDLMARRFRGLDRVLTDAR